MAPSIDPDSRATRLRRSVDLAAFVLLVAYLSAKVEDIPTRRPACSPAEIIAKVLCQSCFRNADWPIRIISPSRKLICDEVEQCMKKRRWQMQVLAKSARLTEDF
jgi:hypothetical protein